jgi:hypothetical protein
MKVPFCMRLLAIALLVTAAAACGGDDDEEETGSPTGSPTAPAEDDAGDEDDAADGEPSELTITAEDYEFDAADELEGGIVELTLANEGNFPHEAAFMKVDAGYELSDFSRDFGAIEEGGPFPDAFESVTGVGDVEGGEELTSTITLPEGDYVLFCALDDTSDEEEGGDEGEEDPEGAAEGEEEAVDEEEEEEPTDAPPAHFELGMLKKVTVAGGADVTAADIPEADGTVEAFDYGFEVPELEAGDATLTLDNTSDEQFHHAIWFEFPEGVDEQGARAAFEAFAEAGEGPPPEGTPEPDEVGFSYIFGPGMGGTFDVTLQSGRTYGVVCFIQDREGGPPHAFAHEMVEIFTVE